MKIPPTAATIAASDKYGRNLEKDHQQRIVAWLNLKGVKRVGIQRTDMRASMPKGWPDLTFCWYAGRREEGDPIIVPVAIECKVKPNKPDKEQLACLADMEADGWTTFVAYSDKEAIDWILSL